MTKRKPKISYRDMLSSREESPAGAAAESRAVAPPAPPAPPGPSAPPPAPPVVIARSRTPVALAAVLNAPARATPHATQPATPLATPPATPPATPSATPSATPVPAAARAMLRPTPGMSAVIAAPGARALSRTTRRIARATVAGRLVLDSAVRHDLAATGHADLLRFRIGPERFALRLADVDEAIEAPVLHPLPDLPRHVLGVVALRGRLVPVHAPTHVLGVSLGSVGVALVLTGEPPIAIAVDDVEDAFTIEAGDLRDAPGVDDPDGVLLGVSRHGGRLVGILDAPALAAACLAPVLPESR